MVGPAADSASRSVRPVVGETCAGRDVGDLALVPPRTLIDCAIAAGVADAALAGLVPHGPRPAGQPVSIRAEAAALSDSAFVVGHAGSYPIRQVKSVDNGRLVRHTTRDWWWSNSPQLVTPLNLQPRYWRLMSQRVASYGAVGHSISID